MNTNLQIKMTVINLVNLINLVKLIKLEVKVEVKVKVKQHFKVLIIKIIYINNGNNVIKQHILYYKNVYIKEKNFMYNILCGNTSTDNV